MIICGHYLRQAELRDSCEIDMKRCYRLRFSGTAGVSCPTRLPGLSRILRAIAHKDQWTLTPLEISPLPNFAHFLVRRRVVILKGRPGV